MAVVGKQWGYGRKTMQREANCKLITIGMQSESK